jgi:hypothetical protein
MKALMIDIETLSLRPTAQVVQVGFCGADLATGEYLIQPVNLYVLAQPNGYIDMDTVRWWMQQSDAARKAVYALPEDAVAVTACQVFNLLRVAYQQLCVGEEKPSATVWGSPAMYDLPILTNMWADAHMAVPGSPDTKPWPYFMERDLMTLYKMLDPDKLHKPANPLEHDAASDAKAQMEHLIAIFRNNPILQGAK